MNHRRAIFTNYRALAAVAAAVVIAVGIAAGQLFAGVGGAAAHQPDGLRMSSSEAAEPPCPYGHDDGCAEAASAAPGLVPGLAPDIADPGGAWAGIYRSSDPHELLPDGEVGHNPDDLAELFDSVAERARQIAVDGDADSGAGFAASEAAILRDDGGDEPGSRESLA